MSARHRVPPRGVASPRPRSCSARRRSRSPPRPSSSSMATARARASTIRRRSHRWAATPGPRSGAQRLNAFQSAANIWGATLTSTTPIIVVRRLRPVALHRDVRGAGRGRHVVGVRELPGRSRRPTRGTTARSPTRSRAGTSIRANRTSSPSSTSTSARPGASRGRSSTSASTTTRRPGSRTSSPSCCTSSATGWASPAVTSGNTGARIGPPFFPAVWEAKRARHDAPASPGCRWTTRSGRARRASRASWSGPVRTPRPRRRRCSSPAPRVWWSAGPTRRPARTTSARRRSDRC